MINLLGHRGNEILLSGHSSGLRFNTTDIIFPIKAVLCFRGHHVTESHLLGHSERLLIKPKDIELHIQDTLYILGYEIIASPLTTIQNLKMGYLRHGILYKK